MLVRRIRLLNSIPVSHTVLSANVLVLSSWGFMISPNSITTVGTTVAVTVLLGVHWKACVWLSDEVFLIVNRMGTINARLSLTVNY